MVAGARLVVQLHLSGRRAAACCAVVALTASALSVSQVSVPVPAAHASVRTTSATSADARQPLVVRDGQGLVRLLGARSGSTLAPSPSGIRDPAAAARAHLLRFGARLGLDRAAVKGLRTMRVTATAGHDAVRFQQTVRGLPVMAGELVVVLDGSQSMLSVGGETTRRVDTTSYDVAGSRAAAVAARATARRHHLARSDVRAGRPGRWLYDASLVDPHGTSGARAVWRVEVTAPGRLDVRDLVLVDAVTGRVSAHIDQIARADRVICDNAEVPSRHYDCMPGYYDRVEGSVASGVPDIDQVYDLTGVTSDWFGSRLGVDLTALIGHDNGDGRKLRSTTRYCPAWGCPLDNAFWSGQQMVYGTAFTSADDVIAHELSHGVTQHTAGLMYWFQSGAINESMSDVIGELVDLSDGIGTDTDETRWLLGEDLSARAGGLTRDMADPPQLGQPDHTGSNLFDPSPEYDDNGGVHTNSGVPNKTAYLITDGTAAEPGGAFNGLAFPGIGTEKAGLLYWSSLLLLTPGSDFTDLSAALQQACANLASVGAAGITPVDCESVAAATTATGLTRWAGPTVPRSVAMSPVAHSLRLSWRPPSSAGDSPITSYAVHVSPMIGEDDFFPIEASARDFRLPDLAPGVDYTVGLVAVTADGTSPSVVRRFAGTAMSVAWPASVRHRSKTLLRGTLTSSGAVPAPGRLVRLLRRDADTRGHHGSYRPVASATTGPDGRFALRLRARPGATYSVSYAGSARELGARSRNVRLPVRVRVSLVADFPGGAGQAGFRGKVTPALPGRPVRLQRGVGAGSWDTVARGRVSGGGRYDLSAHTSGGGAERWRVVVLPGPAPRHGLVAGTSRQVAPTDS